MKRLNVLFFSSLICFTAIAQSTMSVIEGYKWNYEEIRQTIEKDDFTSTRYIDENCYDLRKSINCFNYDCDDNLNWLIKDNLCWLIKDDFYNYYGNLGHFVNTPLKRKRFLESDTFKILTSRFQHDREAFSKRCCYFTLDHFELSDNYHPDYGDYILDFEKFSFDYCDDGGGWITVDCGRFSRPISNVFYPYNRNVLLPSDMFICYPVLPLFRKINNHDCNVFMEIKIDSNKVLELEDNRSNLEVYFISWGGFRKGDKYKDNLKIWIKDPYRKEIREYYVANKVRMVIANKQTGKIYYSKLYAQNLTKSTTGKKR